MPKAVICLRLLRQIASDLTQDALNAVFDNRKDFLFDKRFLLFSRRAQLCFDNGINPIISPILVIDDSEINRTPGKSAISNTRNTFRDNY